MTLAAVEDLSLPRLALEIAVDQLTRPETHRIEQDGEAVRATLPSLLDQLEAAKTANSGRGGSFAAVSKPPLWIDAVSLLEEIDVHVRPYSSRRGRAGRVRAWSGHAHDLTDRDVLESVVRQAEGWVRRARALLDPDPPTPIEGACPECGKTWIDALNEEGERVKRRALLATERPAVAWCESLSCAAQWEGEALWLLADALKAQTMNETLAEEPNP